MTTTLRMFYARAFFVFMFFAFVFLIAVAGVAFAQDAAPVAPPERDLIDLIFSTTSAAIYWLVAGVWVALKPPSWVKDFFTTNESFKWDGIVDKNLDRAEALARKWGHDALKDRNGWINAMAVGLQQFGPEIVDYFDKNKDGVVDFLEGYMPPRDMKVSPGLVALIATRLPEGSAPPPKSASASAPLPFAAPTKARRKTESVQ